MDSYPDMDEVRSFVEVEDLAPLQAKLIKPANSVCSPTVTETSPAHHPVPVPLWFARGSTGESAERLR
jgi:hypothetical protein